MRLVRDSAVGFFELKYSLMNTQKKPPKKACAKCAQLQAELDKMKDLAGRAQADLQNAKDRMQREGEDIRKFALENTLLSLLPTIDNFQRAFDHLPEELSDHDWVKGVQAIEQDLVSKLSAMGLERIECKGETVDPDKHEVLQTGSGEEGIITDVVEDGYTFNGRLIRPAKVVVGDGDNN